MLYSYYGVAGYGYESIPKSFSLISRLLLQFVSGPYLFVCAAILVAGWLFRLVASRLALPASSGVGDLGIAGG